LQRGLVDTESDQLAGNAILPFKLIFISLKSQKQELLLTYFHPEMLQVLFLHHTESKTPSHFYLKKAPQKKRCESDMFP